jgi:tetratricopeptide (TPR) repeat protein
MFSKESTRPPGGDRAKYADDMKAFGMDPAMLLAGIDECLNATVVFQIEDDLVLSPDFLLLGEKWFPNWRTDHIAAFRTLIAAFTTLDHHGSFDLDFGEVLLGWGSAIGAWKEAGLLCVRICTWYGQQGRLEEMEGVIKRTVAHLEGEEKLILEGHLITMFTDSGRYAEALNLHHAIEARVRLLPQNEDEYFRNLIACLTQQIDCLLELDRGDEALALWHDASEVEAEWSEPAADVRPRLLGQRAQIYAHAGDLDSALNDIGEAINLAEKCPGVLAAELRTTRCDFLRRLDRLLEAEVELRKVEPFADSGRLRSRFLHIKGLLMEERQDPRWTEHVLESYEHDRQRGDLAGVAISLVTMARIFIDQGEIGRARERLREAFPYIRRCGLANIMGTFARLWGEIELAEGSQSAGRSWLAGDG